MRISRNELYITIAETFAKRSTCGRLQVGCAIVKDGRIICCGYNGVLPLSPGCKCDLNKPCERSIHAEANAISYAAKNGIALRGSTLYVTHSPCLKCAELVIQAGIKEVIYKELFRSEEGLLLLNNNDIPTFKYEQI